jgi:superfamily II DNA/RNA helicase
MSFDKFNFSAQINAMLHKINFIKPTPIQSKVIPLVLEKKDVMAKAQTGSGKTASFVLPVIDILLKDKREGKAKPRVLVITPTRELTTQVSEVFESFGAGLKVISIIGGEGIGSQLYDIQQGCDIIVATSGRLLDVFSKKQMNLSKLEFFILDEADKMLDLGFSIELDNILKELPQKRQNLLFSATFPQKILDIANKITKNFTKVIVEEEKQIVKSINQRAIQIDQENRRVLLRELLKTNKWKLVLVFISTKRAADNIAIKFRKYGYKAESFHGNLEQDERKYTLEDFKNKKINILFATDIAARGLDIDDIECVVNYDLPRSPIDYIHRIGRTARAGKSGTAISFITHENSEHFKLIERKCQISLEKEQIKGFELTGVSLRKHKGKAPLKGKRKSKKDKLREKNSKDI